MAHPYPATSFDVPTYARTFPQKIEAPVRDTKPDGAKLNVEDRDNDDVLRSKELNRDTEWFGTEVGFLDGEPWLN